ncbi:hypothetical protein [Mycobacterium kubicae]|uniref:ATP-grasp domain-containing protein n=2 Tax=Mycobacterium kubicae TaxID=120959 RepID=A0AAX1J767_9MYCO|nr:hypothetical protein [Mycobacterium kubicae]MCV7097493.1 hypothetical protein [Mycobacterium kubicae]ORV96463.1 hypothetical protein AWC13_18650 [Mycobacterium kubicae]QNI12673.1 hypothetical protein GAN18_16985 [Mycobacterium kubicae]QPI36194.1 hypothetical protein I2456_16765 [Mycobacterium kubicae]
MTNRVRLLAEVCQRLGNRRLVWAGLRGDDIEPLADLPQLHASFSIVGSYEHRMLMTSLAYENLTGMRLDPELWDIDDHLDADATIEFRRALLAALNSESVLLPYRPSNFLSAIHFARQDRCTQLGLFGAQQSAFEHKPWVESAIRGLGLPSIPWTYIADEEQLRARDLCSRGAVVLRRSRTSGGEGFTRVHSPEELIRQWPNVAESFVSVAPYLQNALPINIGATVWADGVTVHHPSVQLIGIKSCVTRDFGYCGNDFGLARDFDHAVICQLETSTTRIGHWLRNHGYLGSFGVDYLLHNGQLLFTEINPRFQGSTHSSCRLDVEAGESCLLLEHVAAWLQVPCPESMPLATRVSNAPNFANLVVHWTGEDGAHVDTGSLMDAVRVVEPQVRADVIVGSAVTNQRGSAVARLALRRRVTRTGFDLDDQLNTAIGQWQTAGATELTGGQA